MSTNRPPAGHDDTGHEHHDRGAPASHSLHDTHHEHAGHGMPAGHDRHAGHSVAMFRDKFWISLLLTLPTLVWGHMLQGALRYTAPQFPASHWIAPIFGIAVFFYGGWVFIQGAIGELRSRQPG